MSTDQPGSQAPWDQATVRPEIVPEPPRKKGLGCGCMVLIGLVIFFVLLVVLCCGGLFGLGFHFAGSASHDPQVAISVTEKMVRMDIPEGLKPAGSLDVQWPVVGGKIVVGAAYADESTQSLLLLASFGEMLEDEAQQEEALQQFDQDTLRELGLSPVVNVEEWNVDEREIEVRGEPVPFRFAVGEDVDSGSQRIEVTGRFQGEDGTVKLWLRADAEKYPEEKIVEMIESIR